MPATITIVGNLGRDPETKYTPNGKMNVALNVAVSSRFRDQSGQQQERTNWFRVTAWGTLAEQLDRMAQQGWLVKGRTVFVSGRFEAREYTANDGAQRTSLDITANEVQLVGLALTVKWWRIVRRISGGGYGGGQQGSSSGGSRAARRRRRRDRFRDLPDSGDVDDIPF